MTYLKREHFRAARAWLGWTQDDLAEHSGVSKVTVRNIERGVTDPRVTTMGALQKAFEDAGIEFLENGVTYTTR